MAPKVGAFRKVLPEEMTGGHFPRKQCPRAASFGGHESNPINLVLTKLGGQEEKSHMEIPCEFDVSSIPEGL